MTLENDQSQMIEKIRACQSTGMVELKSLLNKCEFIDHQIYDSMVVPEINEVSEMKLFVCDCGFDSIYVVAESKEHAVQLTIEQTGKDLSHMDWNEYEQGVVVDGR